MLQYMLLPMVLQYATEKFKYDDEGRISPEHKDIDATNEVDIIFNEKICKKFKSDDEVQISAEDKDIDAEVDIFLNEKIWKMFCSVTCSEGWYRVLQCSSRMRG